MPAARRTPAFNADAHAQIFQGREFVGIWTSLLARRDLGPTDKLVYGLLYSHTRGFERPTWVRQETVAARLGLGVNTVNRAIGRLGEAGLVSVKRRGKTQTALYWCHDPEAPAEGVTHQSGESHAPSDSPKWRVTRPSDSPNWGRENMHGVEKRRTGKHAQPAHAATSQTVAVQRGLPGEPDALLSVKVPPFLSRGDAATAGGLGLPQLWAAALELLRHDPRLTPAAIKTYLELAEPVGYDGRVFQLAAANSYAAEHVAGHLAGPVRDALRDATGAAVELEVGTLRGAAAG